MERIRTGLVRLGRDIYNLRFALLAIGIYYLTVHALFGQFCPMMILLHLPCPGCGMTRALFLVLSGRLGMAWELQPLVYGWILLVLLSGVNRYLLGHKPKLLTGFLVVLLLATLILYAYRIYSGFPPELVGQ